jgi:LysM repeat protein
MRISNVAPLIAPEIAANGASARKKPMRPRSSFDGAYADDFSSSGRRCDKMAGPCFYMVQRGDTIYSVARKMGVSPKSILSANNISKDEELIPGQTIRIECSRRAEDEILCPKEESCAVVEPVKIEVANVEPVIIKKDPVKVEQAGGTVYTVQSGDSLSRIAKLHGTTVRGLKELNNLASDKLLIGQKLSVPPPGSGKIHSPASYGLAAKGQLDGDGRYVVAEGDSLCVIARHLGVKQSELQSANNLNDPNKLRIGQKLVIPGIGGGIASTKRGIASASGAKHSLPSARQKKSTPPSVSIGSDMYTIKDGDTVDAVASELGVSVEDLIGMNSLEGGTVLQAGKKLLIPERKYGTRVSTSKTIAEESFFDNFDEIPVIEVNN